MHLIGIHISSHPEEILLAIEEAYKAGANIVQFFVNNSIKDKTIYKKVNYLLISKGMKCVVHISYTVNLASNWDQYSFNLQQFIDEINLASIVEAMSVVVHMGKKLELSLEEAINNMYTSLLYVHQQTKNTGIKILLETSTGQGSEIGYKIDELAIIYRKFSKHKNKEIADRFGICLDTCHVFSAGYNLSNKETREIFFDNFNELIGLKEIKLVHLNNSKVPCGTKVDRHENISNGYITEKALVKIANNFKKKMVPIILETSYPKILDDLKLLIL
jgi:apurinic endonuclease APN1